MNLPTIASESAPSCVGNSATSNLCEIKGEKERDYDYSAAANPLCEPSLAPVVTDTSDVHFSPQSEASLSHDGIVMSSIGDNRNAISSDRFCKYRQQFMSADIEAIRANCRLRGISHEGNRTVLIDKLVLHLSQRERERV